MFKKIYLCKFEVRIEYMYIYTHLVMYLWLRQWVNLTNTFTTTQLKQINHKCPFWSTNIMNILTLKCILPKDIKWPYSNGQYLQFHNDRKELMRLELGQLELGASFYVSSNNRMNYSYLKNTVIANLFAFIEKFAF